MQLNTVTNRLVSLFNPTGKLLYDVVVPAVIMAVGGVLLAISGILSENAAMWCSGVGVVIHFLLSCFAGFLIREKKEDGKRHGMSGNEHG